MRRRVQRFEGAAAITTQGLMSTLYRDATAGRANREGMTELGEAEQGVRNKRGLQVISFALARAS